MAALADVSLDVREGEKLAIMGPSGSGKTTLLSILGCLDRPTGGEHLFEGRSVAELDDDTLSRLRNRAIGFVFQSFHLVPRLSAAQNVELPMIFAGVERQERTKRVETALDAVGLSERAGHRPDQLSGGERQRVAIARSVVMGPKVLLADEPTGNLDTTSGKEVIALLESMNAAGLTLVVVTHNPEIGDHAHRRIRLMDGGVAEDLQ